MKTRPRRSARHDDPIKDATVDALNQVLEPLIELMLDAGVTVHEFNKLVRQRAVRLAMRRLVALGGKESKSRAAIMTGLTRSEVAKILGTSEVTSVTQLGQLPARRILAAWNDDTRFSEPSGNPAVLPIFGKGPSFEHLVEKYGGNIPVRAMLDELTQIKAVERLTDQRVKVLVRVPILTGLTPQSIAAVGERSRDLLQTLAHNRRRPLQPLFEATAVSNESDCDMISFVRREISDQGTDLITRAASLLKRSELRKNVKNSNNKRCLRAGVTIFYFEDEVDVTDKTPKDINKNKRTNLRRQRAKKTLLETASK